MKVIVNIKNQGITETHRIMIGKDAYYNPWLTPPTVSKDYWRSRLQSFMSDTCNLKKSDSEVLGLVYDIATGIHNDKIYFGEIFDLLEEKDEMIDKETRNRIMQILEQYYGDEIWEQHYADYESMKNPFQTYTFADLSCPEDVYEFIIPDDRTREYQRMILECLLTIFAHGGFLKNGIKIIGE